MQRMPLKCDVIYKVDDVLYLMTLFSRKSLDYQNAYRDISRFFVCFCRYDMYTTAKAMQEI